MINEISSYWHRSILTFSTFEHKHQLEKNSLDISIRSFIENKCLKSWFFKKKNFISSIGKWTYISLQCSNCVKTSLADLDFGSTMITFTKAHQFEDLKSLKNSRRDFHGIKKWKWRFVLFYLNWKILFLVKSTYKTW